jgi:hypothetical protein
MNHAGVAELADAPDLGSGGQPWGFKSLHPHHSSTQGLRKHGKPFVMCKCGRSSIGRASPCQGEGRGFETRRPLQNDFSAGSFTRSGFTLADESRE